MNTKKVFGLTVASILAAGACNSAVGNIGKETPCVDVPGAAGGNGGSGGSGGSAGAPGCPANLLDCGGMCVDAMNDPAHCGECGNGCENGQFCAGGTCKTAKICAAGTIEPCYTASIATMGVGRCKAGRRVCNADGTSFGECTAEITPSTEICYTKHDENCDGVVNENCNALKACNELPKGAPSGRYAIQPGQDAFETYCDMDTDSGGWTLVFSQKDEVRWRTDDLVNYRWFHPDVAGLIANSVEVMVYFANQSNTAVAEGFEKFKFVRPPQFETLWTNQNVPSAYLFNTAVNLSYGNLIEDVTGSRYSPNSFQTMLSDPDMAGTWHGRLGINTSRNSGPFFNGWTVVRDNLTYLGVQTLCAHNQEPYNKSVCSDWRYLVIWAR